MTTVSVEEAGPRLAELVKLVMAGERVVITGEGASRVELKVKTATALSQTKRTGPRRLGLLEGKLVVDERFFEPLPEDELKLWNCEG